MICISSQKKIQKTELDSLEFISLSIGCSGPPERKRGGNIPPGRAKERRSVAVKPKNHYYCFPFSWKGGKKRREKCLLPRKERLFAEPAVRCKKRGEKVSKRCSTRKKKSRTYPYFLKNKGKRGERGPRRCRRTNAREICRIGTDCKGERTKFADLLLSAEEKREKVHTEAFSFLRRGSALSGIQKRRGKKKGGGREDRYIYLVSQ